jgi:AcrR family transcriptional regulator
MNRRERDQRVRQSREAIVESFDGLVLSRPYDDIHVADIVGNAGVGRSTFYEHFRSKDELLRHSVTAVLGVLADAATDAGDGGSIRCMLDHFLENRRASRALLNGPSAAPIERRHAELIEARLSGAALIIPLRLAAAQVASGQLGLVREWLERNEPCDSAALARAMLQTTRSAVSALRAGTVPIPVVGNGDCPPPVPES